MHKLNPIRLVQTYNLCAMYHSTNADLRSCIFCRTYCRVLMALFLTLVPDATPRRWRWRCQAFHVIAKSQMICGRSSTASSREVASDLVWNWSYKERRCVSTSQYQSLCFVLYIDHQVPKSSSWNTTCQTILHSSQACRSGRDLNGRRPLLTILATFLLCCWSQPSGISGRRTQSTRSLQSTRSKLPRLQT